MSAAAVALAAQERYRGAGTVEFVVDADTGEFFFLEMNTRIQVEHPVTEMTTGLDLVDAADPARPRRRSLRPDAGQDQAAGQRDRVPDLRREPGKDVPAVAGPLEVFRLPEPAEGLRIDTGVREGDHITPHYDPLIAKLICHGADRGQAIARSVAGVARESRSRASTAICSS